VNHLWLTLELLRILPSSGSNHAARHIKPTSKANLVVGGLSAKRNYLETGLGETNGDLLDPTSEHERWSLRENVTFE
jgi:hypothetical protein